jgi:hypothetical protein
MFLLHGVKDVEKCGNKWARSAKFPEEFAASILKAEDRSINFVPKIGACLSNYLLSYHKKL